MIRPWASPFSHSIQRRSAAPAPSGVTSFAELNPSYVAPVAPIVRQNWLDSAFPLLKEGY